MAGLVTRSTGLCPTAAPSEGLSGYLDLNQFLALRVGDMHGHAGGFEGRGTQARCTKKGSPRTSGRQNSGKACSWEVDSEARDGNYGQPGYSACFITRSAPAGYRAGSLALPDIRALTGCDFEALPTLLSGVPPRLSHRLSPDRKLLVRQSGVASASLVGCEKRIADRPNCAYRHRPISLQISVTC